jgi:hypothetical protein
MDVRLNWFRADGVRRWIGALAIILLFARALIPAGFMVNALDGDTRLVLCSAAVADSSGLPASHHGSTTGSDSSCPFAASASVAPPPAAIHFVAGESTAPLLSTRATPSVSVPPPPRYLAPRGPPSLA